MIRAGILGATGYAGAEVCRLLATRDDVEITLLGSQSYVGQNFSDIYTNLKGILDLECEAGDVDTVAEKCDVVFTALPHGASKEVIPKLYEKGLTVIDLSGDFRYNDVKVYEKWYGDKHCAPHLLGVSVYGLPELHREEIKKTKLIANPGCYTTCSILAIAPLLDAKIGDTKNIIIDAKSGVTGAGRSAKVPSLFCECDESLKAYGVGTHRHTSEIEQELSLVAGEEITLSFTPHLVPIKRGILATSYVNLLKDVSAEELVTLYKEFYKGEKFVRILDAGKLPEIKNVAHSNYIDIGIVVDKRLRRAVIVSCIDNLIKGAAGQAVQNMNIVFGREESAGLLMPPTFV